MRFDKLQIDIPFPVINIHTVYSCPIDFFSWSKKRFPNPVYFKPQNDELNLKKSPGILPVRKCISCLAAAVEQ